MKSRLDPAVAAGFAPACAFESSEEWTRELMAERLAHRRRDGWMATGVSIAATLAIAALLVVM